jgi:hypothetical protein
MLRCLQQMPDFIRSWWSNAFPRGQSSADFLKVTSVLGGREKQVKHRILAALQARRHSVLFGCGSAALLSFQSSRSVIA